MSAIRNLRAYIRLTSEDELIDAIEKITDITLLRYIIEAGAKPRIMRATTKRYDALKARMGGE